MKKIGTFEGIPCYTCSKEEYCKSICFCDDSNIYIVDGKMTKKNSIIASYEDGRVYLIDKPHKNFLSDKEVEYWYHKYLGIMISYKNSMKKESNKEIDFDSLLDEVKFENYTIEVDNFFKDLKDIDWESV